MGLTGNQSAFLGFFLYCNSKKICKTTFDTELSCQFSRNFVNLTGEVYVYVGERKV